MFLGTTPQQGVVLHKGFSQIPAQLLSAVNILILYILQTAKTAFANSSAIIRLSSWACTVIFVMVLSGSIIAEKAHYFLTPCIPLTLFDISAFDIRTHRSLASLYECWEFRQTLIFWHAVAREVHYAGPLNSELRGPLKYQFEACTPQQAVLHRAQHDWPLLPAVQLRMLRALCSPGSKVACAPQLAHFRTRGRAACLEKLASNW
jgi:hypothetical protein